jgi:hypothetical protein
MIPMLDSNKGLLDVKVVVLQMAVLRTVITVYEVKHIIGHRKRPLFPPNELKGYEWVMKTPIMNYKVTNNTNNTS